MLYAPSSSGNTPRALTYAAADAVAALQIGDEVTAVLLKFNATLLDEITQASKPHQYKFGFELVSTLTTRPQADTWSVIKLG